MSTEPIGMKIKKQPKPPCHSTVTKQKLVQAASRKALLAMLPFCFLSIMRCSLPLTTHRSDTYPMLYNGIIYDMCGRHNYHNHVTEPILLSNGLQLTRYHLPWYHKKRDTLTSLFFFLSSLVLFNFIYPPRNSRAQQVSHWGIPQW